MVSLCLLIPLSAFGAVVAQDDSPLFELDTRAYLGPFFGGEYADSELFELDTRWGSLAVGVSGTVYDGASGRPLSAVGIEIGGSQTQTDLNGLYSF
jgi:hypothetical protein